MNLLRWAGGAVLLLSAGALANCSQLFDPPAATGDGIANAALVGAEADAANGISHVAAGPSSGILPSKG